MFEKKSLSKKALSFFFILITFIFFNFTVQAEVVVKPYISVDGISTNNYFRAETGTISLRILTLQPGITIDAFTDRSRLLLDYKLSHWSHYNESAVFTASDLNYIGHDLSLFAATSLSARTQVGLTDTFTLTRDPAALNALNNSVARDVYYINEIGPFLSYNIAEKGTIRIDLKNQFLKYTENVLKENSYENRGILTLTYNFNDITHIDLEAQTWKRVYSLLTNDFTSSQGKVIFRYDFTEFAQANIGGGFQRRTFKNNAMSALSGTTFSAGLNLETDRNLLFISFDHNINEISTDDNYYMANILSVYYKNQLTRRISALVGGSYQNNNYMTSTRVDTSRNIFGGFGIKLFNKRLELSSEYHYTVRNSNVSGQSYNENSILLKGDFSFNVDNGN